MVHVLKLFDIVFFILQPRVTGRFIPYSVIDEGEVWEIEMDEFTKKLKIKGFEHVWINPKVEEAIRKEQAKEIFNDLDKAIPRGVSPYWDRKEVLKKKHLGGKD